MKQQQFQVETFMACAQQQVPHKPCFPCVEIQELRLKLIREEAKELQCATDLYQIADAIGDLLYVTLGTAVAYGINIAPIFDEIHRSNMTKFKDGHLGFDGKWIKGPSYEPAQLKPLIDAQLND